MNTIITIGRESGSAGHKIGKLLAEELGIPCYDRELLEKARLLPPQIAQVAMLLGNGFENIFEADEMINRIKEMRNK